MSTQTKICQVQSLGLWDYQEAWDYQKQCVEARSHHQGHDTLLLLEHPHTYTLGSSGKREHLLMSEAECHAKGISVYHVDRGGDITYHGPGQLVGYPIIMLPTGPGAVRADVIAYVRNIEAVIIKALATFDIQGKRIEGLTGVWVLEEGQWSKIAAIGVKINTRRVTYHGFALNVAPDMRFFNGIIPCGITDKPLTSMSQFLGQEVAFASVQDAVIEAFGQVFAYEMQISLTRT